MKETFHDYCKQQIFRFAGRMGWPDPKEYPAAVKDLIDALEVRASRGSRELAKRIVDACVESGPYCPTVPDILRVGQEFREKEQTGPKYGFTGCEACNHSGWISVQRNGYDFSEPCVCRSNPKPMDSKTRNASGLQAAADWARKAAGERD